MNHFAVQGEIMLHGFSGGPIVIDNNTIGTACSGVTGFSQGYGYVGIYVEQPGAAFSPSLKITNNQISMAAPVRDGYGIELLCNANSTLVLNFEIANNSVGWFLDAYGVVVDRAGSAACAAWVLHV